MTSLLKNMESLQLQLQDKEQLIKDLKQQGKDISHCLSCMIVCVSSGEFSASFDEQRAKI